MKSFFRSRLTKGIFVGFLVFLALFVLKNVSLASTVSVQGRAPVTVTREIAGQPGSTVTVTKNFPARSASSSWDQGVVYLLADNGTFSASWQSGPAGGVTITVTATQTNGENSDRFAARCAGLVRSQMQMFPPAVPQTQQPGNGAGGVRGIGGSRRENVDDTFRASWRAWPEDIRVVLGSKREPGESDPVFAQRTGEKHAAFLFEFQLH